MLSLEELFALALEIDNADRVREDEVLQYVNEIYDELYDEIIDVILAFYGEYGEDVTWNELNKGIQGNKVKQTAKRMERLRKLKDNTDNRFVRGKIQEEIQHLRGRGLLTHDKFLTDRINEKMIVATTKVAISFNRLLGGTFAREFERATGKKVKDLDKRVLVPQYGKNWLDRLMDNKNKTLSTIKVELIRGIRSGRNPRETIKKIQKLGEMSKYEAERLVRTENALARVEGAIEGYMEDELIQKVIIIAVGDKVTCPDCKARDGTIMKKEDVRADGIILHAHCRCTIAPYLE